MTTPIALIVSIHVLDGHAEEYLRLSRPVLDAMRHEPTFINTVQHRDPDDPNRFMLYETWADRAEFFEVQMTRPYRLPYERRLAEILRTPRTMHVWEPLRADFTFFDRSR
ncbi:putative quinol monooxygenase [Amycolatopsis sp. NPDC059657]|uniref:putative quinol monooxygenase n=1 Tax=Amycolatopsis sp. NPDC059657 TaxID=3346899 RepID=UPI00367205C9